jgi:ATP-dependent HslUV protease ATP-binding subunit HslU
MLETVDRRKPLRRSRRVALSLLMRLTRFVLRATQVGSRSADASAEGVQRDLLPLIEERSLVPSTATSIPITFSLCVGHSVKPSDLLPELQGRLRFVSGERTHGG